MNKSHVQKAVEAVAQSNARAAAQARISERRWWRQELAKLIASAEELHGPGAVVSASQLLGVSNKRGGDS